MTQVSKYPISKPIADRIFEIFVKALIGINKRSQVEQFLNDLLSPVERIMLVKRLAIAFLLEKGYDHRTISRILRVSLPTVVSVNRARKFGNAGYTSVINSILKEEKLNEMIVKLGLKLVSIPAESSGKGSGTWRYLKQELEKKANKKTSF